MRRFAALALTLAVGLPALARADDDDHRKHEEHEEHEWREHHRAPILVPQAPVYQDNGYYAPDGTWVPYQAPSPYYAPPGGYYTPRGGYYAPGDRDDDAWRRHEWREHERREHHDEDDD